MAQNRIRECVQVGLESALSAVNKLSGGRAFVVSSEHGFVPLGDVRMLSGSVERPALGAYIPFQGDAWGQVVIFFRPEQASELVHSLSPETTDGLSPEDIEEMHDSIVSEVANIIGTHLLNAMADEAGIRLLPKPPVIVSDMSGAILGSTLALAGICDDTVFVGDLKVAIQDRAVSYEVILLPGSGMREGELAGSDI